MLVAAVVFAPAQSELLLLSVPGKLMLCQRGTEGVLASKSLWDIFGSGLMAATTPDPEPPTLGRFLTGYIPGKYFFSFRGKITETRKKCGGSYYGLVSCFMRLQRLPI